MTTFPPDPAETETASRRKAAFATTFDSLVASNLQLSRTVQVAVKVMTVCALLSLLWTVIAMYSMRSTLSEMHVMLQTVLDTMVRR